MRLKTPINVFSSAEEEVFSAGEKVNMMDVRQNSETVGFTSSAIKDVHM